MTASKKNKASTTFSDKGTLLKLENLMGAAFAKLKNFWKSQSAHTGIQFYIESDD
jgi:hypothetical protein